ncbi:hypothetical protein RB595_000160 [Gaeumannomyces hyphopodioides]
MALGEPVLYSLYVYAPDQGAPIFFAIAFALSAIFHIWQCYRYKAWKLIGLHPLCAVFFTAGYALRAYGSHHYLYLPSDKSPLYIFILSQVFIFICPPLLELANYHVLGRIFYYVPYLAPISPGRVLAIFGGLMAVVELLNALGVALAANPTSSSGQQGNGQGLILAAVSIQIGLIAVFVSVAILFHRRCIRADKLPSRSRAIRVLMPTLYGSMALIFIRCIYRLVEHTAPTKVKLDNMEALRSLSPILRYEVYFYIFEASLMFLNSVIWNVWHPGRFLPHSHHVYLARDGAEVEGEKVIDGRPAWAKVAHVLTFGLLFGRKKQADGAFQELSELPNGSNAARPRAESRIPINPAPASS